MDRRVYLIQPVIGTSPTNADRKEAYELVPVNPIVFALKRDISGSEMIIADRPTYVQRTEWIIDSRNDLSIGHRLVNNSEVYDIVAMLDYESGRRRYMKLVTYKIDTQEWGLMPEFTTEFTVETDS